LTLRWIGRADLQGAGLGDVQRDVAMPGVWMACDSWKDGCA
jgi:hypothetical protein